jgi:hypothetical protein
MPRRTQDSWLTAAAAARVLSVEPRNVKELARRGAIVARELPGVRARYRRDSVEELARLARGVKS